MTKITVTPTGKTADRTFLLQKGWFSVKEMGIVEIWDGEMHGPAILVAAFADGTWKEVKGYETGPQEKAE